MSKLPVLKTKELIKVLNRMGFFQFHRVGSHTQFKHTDGKRTTIPIHYNKDIPRGILMAILKDIEISREELIKILKK
jgi:predicted RNA binding protein YcfA (HicA-like mRNA interferase family)